jgi:hypothetical protein
VTPPVTREPGESAWPWSDGCVWEGLVPRPPFSASKEASFGRPSTNGFCCGGEFYIKYIKALISFYLKFNVLI